MLAAHVVKLMKSRGMERKKKLKLDGGILVEYDDDAISDVNKFINMTDWRLAQSILTTAMIDAAYNVHHVLTCSCIQSRA